MKRYSVTLIAVALFAGFASTLASANEVLFQIGYPDGKAAEFRSPVKWEDFFDKENPVVREYTVGKSRTRDWFPWHNSTREWHAAGRSFTGRIHFNSAKTWDVPLYLVIGTCYGHATEPSLINVTVNGTAVEPVRVKPGPPGFPKYQWPTDYGWPETNVVPIPAGLVKQGENVLDIRLTDGSWSIYDYLVLQTSDAAPAIVKAEDALKAKFEPGGDMDDVKEILFAVHKPSNDGHWYASFGYYACCGEKNPPYPFPLGEGGSLRILNVKTGEVRTIFEDKQGNVRDPQIHYDGKKAIFSYLKAGTKHYHLYEINLDGTGLRQITTGSNALGEDDWDDIEPTYLPNGDIVFCSSRAKRWVQCWLVGVATLYRCGPNGENVHAISSNPEQENTPWVLSNGQLIYMRWEYIDRSQVNYHHLWTANPDGTRHQIYFGNLHPGTTMLAAKPIRYKDAVPDEQRRYQVVCTFSPGHGRREHYGTVTLIDPRNGPDDLASTRSVSTSANYADPWAFSEDSFIAAKNSHLVVMDGDGREADLYVLPEEEASQKFWVSDPQPVIVRQREPVIADTIDTTPREAPTGRLAMADIYQGRRMKDLPRGTVKKLLIMEPLPIPVHYNGGMMSVSTGGTFSLERIIGEVPVNEDGSCYMELPANRSLFFIALDKDGKAVKRMHSFTTLMPGENATCIGCHEQRTQTPTAADQKRLFDAMTHAPAKPQKVEGVPEVFDYMRDIRPIVDKYCVECHREDNMQAGVNLSSDLKVSSFVASYSTLSHRNGGMLGDNRNRPQSDFPPYTIGSAASTFYQMLENGHPDKDGKVRYTVTPEDLRMVRYWIESGANYAGTYAADACGELRWHYSPYDKDGIERGRAVNADEDWPETKAMAEVINRRCASCHNGEKRLPSRLTEMTKFANPGWTVNLSYPEKSRLIRGPLAAEAGGMQRCWKEVDGKRVPEIVFKDKSDPDYQTMLKAIERGRHFVTVERTHFSFAPTQPFYPNEWYVREMKRYGVLPPDFQFGTPINPYETDQKYWELLQSEWQVKGN
ncbi:MAG: hypothetical protein IJQ39_01705 [Thermoguttaceae bacterium]|nr:hypothetical protein [Thermoguttaceae bacterium]